MDDLESISSLDPPAMLLLEFKAGRMNYDGKLVSADPRKGLIQIIRTTESINHFRWLDRSTHIIEEDQIVFPDEAVFEKVEKSKGRVYLLRFKHDDRRFFYWMQESSLAEDDLNCDAVNSLLNQVFGDEREAEEEANSRQASIQTSNQGPRNQDLGALQRPAEELKLLLSRFQQQVQRPSTVVASNPVSQTPMDDLASILANLKHSRESVEQMREAQLSLSKVLAPESVLPLLQQPGVHERLASFLPEELRSLEAMKEVILSPQFRQQVDGFSQMLQRGMIDWRQFGMEPRNDNVGVSSFLSAVMELAASQQVEEDAKNKQIEEVGEKVQQGGESPVDKKARKEDGGSESGS